MAMATWLATVAMAIGQLLASSVATASGHTPVATVATGQSVANGRGQQVGHGGLSALPETR